MCSVVDYGVYLILLLLKDNFCASSSAAFSLPSKIIYKKQLVGKIQTRSMFFYVEPISTHPLCNSLYRDRKGKKKNYIANVYFRQLHRARVSFRRGIISSSQYSYNPTKRIVFAPRLFVSHLYINRDWKIELLKGSRVLFLHVFRCHCP